MSASALPNPNEISEALKSSTKTVYHYLNFMRTNVVNSARASIHECVVCPKGCIAYVGLNCDRQSCPICYSVRTLSSEVMYSIFLFTIYLLQFTIYLLLFTNYLLRFTIIYYFIYSFITILYYNLLIIYYYLLFNY